MCVYLPAITRRPDLIVLGRHLKRINEEHLDHVARASSIPDVSRLIRRSIKARDEAL